MKNIIEYLNNKERYIIQNITFIAVLLIIIILLIDILPLIINLIFDTKYNFISTQFTITTIGGIFAFWYGYKKYERDKELEIIEKYTKEYNEIKNNINNEITKNGLNGKPNYFKLIDFFYKEYYLFKRGYISNELWNDWKYWIKLDINYIITFDIQNTKKDINKKPYIIDILALYNIKKSRSKNNGFLVFLQETLQESKSDLEKSIIENDDILEEFRLLKIDLIETILKLLTNQN